LLSHSREWTFILKELPKVYLPYKTWSDTLLQLFNATRSGPSDPLFPPPKSSPWLTPAPSFTMLPP
jgi:hypothetical protein